VWAGQTKSWLNKGPKRNGDKKERKRKQQKNKCRKEKKNKRGLAALRRQGCGDL
jgi:hypothetical protein